METLHLRLPSYMCQFNPIELAWIELKRKIKELNMSTLQGSTYTAVMGKLLQTRGDY